MLSSILAFGLLFVLFLGTVARPSRGNPVISYAKWLQFSSQSGIHFNSTKSTHAASDSTNPSSWLRYNVIRAPNITKSGNISLLDALRLAPVDNSSNIVEVPKSSLVVNEINNPICYPSRIAAPIITPADCSIAIYELTSAGDPEEAVLWRGRQTWNWLTCKVELVPRAHYPELITRLELAQAAALIKRDCVTPEHGYRGGYVAVGSLSMFDMTVWASTSSVAVNVTTSAFSPLLESPDLLEMGADSPLKGPILSRGLPPTKTPQQNLAYITGVAGLSTFTPECFREAKGPSIVPIANPFDCYEATSKIFAGPPRQIWDSEKLWMFGSCAVGLVPTTMLILPDVFTRNDIAYNAILTKNLCVNKENQYLGGTVPIGELAAFRVVVCASGNSEITNNLLSLSSRCKSFSSVVENQNVYSCTNR